MTFRTFRFSMLLFSFFLTFSLGKAEASSKPIEVVVTIPDLGWVAQEIGKEHVHVQSLLDGTENPHYVDAVPKYIKWAADADVVCFAGLDLEVGWLPKVLERSGNGRVQPGGKGYCEVGQSIKALEKPTGPIDRSMGDLHPYGNPHFWLSPKRLAQGAEKVLSVLIDARPNQAATFTKNYADLKNRLDEILKSNKERLSEALAGVKGPHLVQYHREFVYFAHDYGLEILSAIEEKPGVPPSAGRLARVALSAKSAGVKFALAATYDPRNHLTRFEEMSSVPALVVPASMQPEKGIDSYPELQKRLMDRIVDALKGDRG